VNSHIIPQGLYWKLEDGNGKVAQLVSPFDGEYQKRRPIGIYGQFLCQKHEKQFNPWDSYAIKLLRDTKPAPVVDGWIFEDVNYQLLKLFFISLLWRAHSANNAFFDINLGSHADRLKKHIDKEDPGTPDQYAVLLTRSEELYAKVVIAPQRQVVDGINFIRFYFPGHVAIIKMDQKDTPESIKNYILNQSGKLFVPRRSFAGEMEEQIILQTAEKNWKRKNGQK